MYVQRCVKGIVGDNGHDGIREDDAKAVVRDARGIWSNWLLNHRKHVSGGAVRGVLTVGNLEQHLHCYASYGANSPFISLACGAVERHTWFQRNIAYSAVDTALMFATENGTRPGALFYLWVLVSHSQVVPLASVAEPVRDLNIYRRWSPYQVEGEVTAKIHIAANQIERVEWWDLGRRATRPRWTQVNVDYVKPEDVSNIREFF